MHRQRIILNYLVPLWIQHVGHARLPEESGVGISPSVNLEDF